MGLRAEQLREVAQLLGARVDAAAGARVRDALTHAQAAKLESR